MFVVIVILFLRSATTTMLFYRMITYVNIRARKKQLISIRTCGVVEVHHQLLHDSAPSLER